MPTSVLADLAGDVPLDGTEERSQRDPNSDLDA
jgi:hypothetical protein